MSKAAQYDPRASQAMAAIVRVSIVAVTLALFFGALLNALLGLRDIAVMLALATPLGISAWGFARAGHNEAAMALLCCVLVTVVTLILVLNPLGFHDVAITAYSGVVLVGALLLSRRAFLAIVGLTLFAATTAFVVELLGHSRSLIARNSGWHQYAEFVVITSVFAGLGRVAAEKLFGSLGDAHDASVRDRVTGLLNRYGFLASAAARLRKVQADGGFAVLVVTDLDSFRRINLVIGHSAADNVLAEGGRRLGFCGGELDCIMGRLGDDEFAVLCTGLTEGQAPAFARSVHEHLNFDYLGVSVRSASGYSRFPRDADGIESLLLAAESGVAGAKAMETDRLAGPADRI